MAKDGMTVTLPVVREHWSVADATTTQILPRIPADVPPSAQHVDPVKAYYQRTFVEDDGLELQSRGKHVLAELAALPDPAEELAAVPQRIIKALGGREAEVKNPKLQMAVRMFRHARDMQRAREARAQRALADADACSRMMREFGEKWDRKLREEEVARHGQRAVVAAEELAATYEGNRLRIAEENARRAADGKPPLDATATTFTRGMVAKIQAMLVDEAKVGSVGVR
jgi:hypothetical protein